MANYSIPQIMDMVHKAKTREQKSQILKDNDEFGLQAVLQTAFHPEVEWLLPKGTPPYAAKPPSNDTPKGLYSEVKKFYLFTKGGGSDHLNAIKREQLFIQMLEVLDPTEAKLVIDVKDKAIIGKYKGLTYKLVKDTWPDLLPEQTEWKKDTPVE